MSQLFKNQKFHRKKIPKIFFSLRNLQIHTLISFYLTIFGVKLDLNFSAVQEFVQAVLKRRVPIVHKHFDF